MKSLLTIGADHARLVVALLILITGIAIVQLPQLRLEVTAEGMMVKSDPARQFYERTLDTFGSDNVTIIYFEDPLLFQPQKLQLIADAVNKINASPLVNHTDSLFSLRYLRTIDSLTYTSPYLKKIPSDYQKALTIRDVALQNPLVKNNLLSVDGTALTVNIYFDPAEYYRGFDEDISAQLRQILQPLEQQFKRVFFVGDPYVRAGISERIRADQQIIIPGAIVLLILTLAISLRNFQAAVIPLLTSGISVIWILGFMAALGIPVNVMNSVIPALLIIIGSTEDIHLLAEYISAPRHGHDRQQPLRFMANNMGKAVMLTFITTYVGFLSISFNDLGLLQQFGWLTSTGLLMNFLVTVLLVPVCLKVFGTVSSGASSSVTDNLFQALTTRVLQVTDKHRVTVMLILVSTILLAAFSAKDLRINNNVMDYFSEDSELVQYSKILHDKISGIQSFSIVLTGTEGTFLQVPYIEELWSIQEYLKETGQFDKSFSFADFLAVVHSGIDNERPGTVYLPEMNEAVEGYMSFLSPAVAKTFVSPDFSQARIIIRHNISNSAHLNEIVAGIYQFTDSWLDPSLDVQVTGESYLNNRAVDYMAIGQAQSLMLMLIVIFVLMSVVFMNFKAGWVVLSTNVFPIVVLFGVMAFLDIPLNTGTAMVAAISLGICVDHSMHFMVRYNRLSKTAESQYQALENTVREESTPIIATAIALAVGFSALSLSDFPPVARFGQLSALVMLLALVSTFVITPLFLRYVRLLSVWDLLSFSLKQDVVRQSPLFTGMHSWQARKIIAMSEIIDYRQDEAILIQGDPMQHLYIPLEGIVESWRTDSDGSAHLLGVVKPGEVFGAVTPQDEQKSSGDMVAITAVRLLLFKSKDVQNVARMYPVLAVKLYRNLCSIVGNYLDHEESKSPQLHDDSSGAYSATIFTELIRYSIDRANRYKEPLSVIILDLESVKIESSQLVGARHLGLQKPALNLISRSIRKPDILGLWGDGSYWIALPRTDSSAATIIASRLMACINDYVHDDEYGLLASMINVELEMDDDLDMLASRVNKKRIANSQRHPLKLERVTPETPFTLQ